MATPKTITAHDIDMGKILLSIKGGILTAIQGYELVDDQGNSLDRLSKGRVEISKDFSELPEDIRQGLTAINTFMYQRALTQEGME